MIVINLKFSRVILIIVKRYTHRFKKLVMCKYLYSKLNENVNMFFLFCKGRCDLKVCMSKNYSMMYRPRWLDNPNDVKGGSKAMEMSKDGHFLTVGSEDGFLFIYHTDSGIPVGQKAPATKHSASVSTCITLAVLTSSFAYVSRNTVPPPTINFIHSWPYIIHVPHTMAMK